jgi:ankyrin repeat protein
LRDDAGRTPLIHAAINGHLGCAKVLLDGGADPSARDETGATAKDWAERSGRDSVADLLADLPGSTPTQTAGGS